MLPNERQLETPDGLSKTTLYVLAAKPQRRQGKKQRTLKYEIINAYIGL